MDDNHSNPRLLSVSPAHPQPKQQDSPLIALTREQSRLFTKLNSHEDHNRSGHLKEGGIPSFSNTGKALPELLSSNAPSPKRGNQKVDSAKGNGIFAQYLQDIGHYPVLKAEDQFSLAKRMARARQKRNRTLSVTPLALGNLLHLLNQAADPCLTGSSLLEESRIQSHPHANDEYISEHVSSSPWLFINEFRGALSEFLRLEKHPGGWSSPDCQTSVKEKFFDARRKIFQDLEMIIFPPGIYDSVIQSLAVTEELLLNLLGADHELKEVTGREGPTRTVEKKKISSSDSTKSRMSLPHPSLTSSALLSVLEQDVLHMKGRSFLKAVARIRQLTSIIQEGKTQLVLGNLRLVISIALNFKNFPIPLSDLIQEGNVALLKAVDRFDYRRGIKFSSYATWWIWKAIRRVIRGRDQLIHLPDYMTLEAKRIAKCFEDLSRHLEHPPSAEELTRYSGYPLDRIELFLNLPIHELSLDTLSSDSSDDPSPNFQFPTPAHLSPFAQASFSELQEIIKANLKRLPRNEAYVLCKRFGLDGHEEQSLAEIAKSQGISKEDTRCMEMRGLRRLSECAIFHEMRTEAGVNVGWKCE